MVFEIILNFIMNVKFNIIVIVKKWLFDFVKVYVYFLFMVWKMIELLIFEDILYGKCIYIIYFINENINIFSNYKLLKKK